MRSVFSLLYMVLYSFFSLFLLIPSPLFSEEKKRKYIYSVVRPLAKGLLFTAGTRLKVKGLENLPKEDGFLVVSTHKSNFDIPILVHLIDHPITFIAKTELTKVPIINHWMKLLHCIFIDRNDPRQSLKAIMEGIDRLKRGHSIVVFPEGTRLKEKGMNPFKKGSLKLATKSNVPIVPIAIDDSYKIMEAQGMGVRSATVFVNIGKPIDLSTLSADIRKNPTEYVQKTVEQLYKECQKDI